MPHQPYELIIFDTYNVVFVRSPRYLDEEIAEAVDEASRAVVDESRLWRRLARQHGLGAAAIEEVQDRLAAKFCKNLDIWKGLPGWSAEARLLLVHGGPAGLVARWRQMYDVDRYFNASLAAADLGLSRDDPALYARIAADAGVDVSRCLVVDDERAPVDAAHDAGCATYRFGAAYGLRALIAAGVAQPMSSLREPAG